MLHLFPTTLTIISCPLHSYPLIPFPHSPQCPVCAGLPARARHISCLLHTFPPLTALSVQPVLGWQPEPDTFPASSTPAPHPVYVSHLPGWGSPPPGRYWWGLPDWGSPHTPSHASPQPSDPQNYLTLTSSTDVKHGIWKAELMV